MLKEVITRRHKLFMLILLPLSLALSVFWHWGAEERALRRQHAEELARIEKIRSIRQTIAKELGPQFAKNEFPLSAEMSWEGKKKDLRFNYTIQPDLQKEAESLLKAYKPDYGAIIVIDSLTGAIRAMASFEKGNPHPENLVIRGTYPAASIFKIVTATAALDKYNLSPDTIVMFNGANHTLYKKNVLYTKVNRWTREMTIKEAFARSVNTVFGRLTFEHLQPKDIEEYAIRFGFNKPIQSDLPFDMGFTSIPNEKNYHLAEIVSGFNRVTKLSPIHGAMIAASVAATGTMRVPYIVETIKDKGDSTLFQAEPVTAAYTMSGEGARRLRDIMEATITQGTSSRSFRPLRRNKKYRELELGGKTGSLQGDSPKGKVDWFVGYAIGGESERLAIATITVNKEFWTVKSSYLAQSMFKKYFKDQFSEQNRKFFNAQKDN